MYLDTQDIIITPGILCWGSWEEETACKLEEILKPGMNWVDVGANNGYFTIIGHRCVQADGGRTWAFEANPKLHKLLTDNIYLNWFWSGVIAEPFAVYSSSCEVTFYIREKYGVNSSIGPVNEKDLRIIYDTQTASRVQAVSLDDYFLPKDIKLDLVKVDVEGGELFVLMGARRLIEANRTLGLLIEWSPQQIHLAGCE